MERTTYGSGALLSGDADNRIGIAKGFGVVSLVSMSLTAGLNTGLQSPTLIPGICVYDSINNNTPNFILD